MSVSKNEKSGKWEVRTYYKDFTGVVTEIDLVNGKCVVEVEMFGGQAVPIADLDLSEVEKVM